MKKIKTFLFLPHRDKLLLLEAIFFLFIAKILLLIFPFKYFTRSFSNKNYIDNVSDQNYLSTIKIAVGRANRLAWWKNVCLVQSFAARWMLQRRKIKSTLSMGVNFDRHQKLIAHAWLNVGDFEVVSKDGNYEVLYSF